MISFLSQLQISYCIKNPLAHTNGGTQEHTLHLSHPMGVSQGICPIEGIIILTNSAK